MAGALRAEPYWQRLRLVAWAGLVLALVPSLGDLRLRELST
jgi:hypothetical protein